VYIEEFEVGAKPIEGVSTSTAGFVGFAERGPLNRPTLVTSFAEYQRIFGGYLPEDQEYDSVRWLPYAVEGFFSNGGKRAYVIRVAGKIAKPASGHIPDISGVTTTLVEEANAGSLLLNIKDATDINPEDLVFLRDGALSEYIQVKFAGHFKALTLNTPLTGSAQEDGTFPSDTKIVKSDSTFTLKDNLSQGDPKINVEEDVSRLAEDNILLLRGKEIEICTVKSVDTGANSIEVKSPLKFKHAKGVKIDLFSDLTEQIDPLSKLENGDITIPVDGGAPLSKDDAVKIGDNYFLVNEVTGPDTLLITKDKIRYTHSVIAGEKQPEIKKLVDAIKVDALNEGKWGNSIKIIIKDSSLSKAKLKGDVANKDTFELSTVNGMEKGTLLKFESTDKDPSYGVVKEVINTGDGKKVQLFNKIPETLKDGINVSSVEFDLIVRFNGSEEVFKFLSMNSDHSRYIEKIITEDSSRLITVKNVSSTGDQAKKIPMPTLDKEPGWLLTGGTDGTPTGAESVEQTYEGKDDVIPENRKGIYALKNKDDISIVAVPGITAQKIQDKIITLCEELKDRFAVLDPGEGINLDEVQEQRNLYDSKYAALYYPWIQAYDHVSSKQINVPPSGHVCGIYARNDNERSVHKAPANEKINGALGLEKISTGTDNENNNGDARIITKGQQEILNPKGINCIIPFPGRGIRVWGARTISSDPLWKYINVRRLFIYIEKSIEKSTQWVIFEPNNERLWARIRATITQFLTGVWKDGALMGTKPEEAFFVKCDRTTMTQDDIDNGRLICIIGIAPTKPAEFVIFRIAQWQGGSAATE
jgi:phage tail sheath protein FI